ncbi:helix-turn-helix transcriptional regulator [Providencia stuartii]|uniref:helix-turn-helix transcriptional regulator n=1 Tax=Providencia stuartii TaxID=588 RepID=UPI00214DCE3C|nr:hypothetical protein [Providencia stuartii]
MIYGEIGIKPVTIHYSMSYHEKEAIKLNNEKKNKTFIGTKELSERLGIKPHTLRVWVSEGKQAKKGFPKPSHRLRELQFRLTDIIDWENGKRF